MNNKKYKLNSEKVLFTPLEEEGILYVIDENKYISLNNTYASIIEYVANGMDFIAIVDQLISDYEVEKELCETQVKAVLADLLAKQFINETVA